MSAATSCAAAQCTVVAVSAVQWLDLRVGGGTRAEPICAGHEQVIMRVIRDNPRDPWVVQAKIISLSDYAARLARTAWTGEVDGFVDRMSAAFDAGTLRFPPPG